MRRASRLPVDGQTVQRAITQIKSELLPIAIEDARWLQRIAETHDAALDEIERLLRLVTFLDSHLVLCYRNGDEWHDVHPLVRDEVRALAASAAGATTASEADPEAPPA